MRLIQKDGIIFEWCEEIVIFPRTTHVGGPDLGVC